ncbi:MAG: ribosome recycling factor [Candidatus Wildermuthbacteria bacterium]|nr:ribosome recycling factor [Candidatus Wildermuthbacteria bacterium]
MYKETEKIKPEIQRAIDFFQKELLKIRTGQASPSLVEDVLVEAFNQKMTLKQLGSISCPDRRQIVIQPWDRSYLGPMEKALQKSNVGANPVVDKDVIRIILPQLTEEYRKTLLKLLSEKAEQTRQIIRRWRDEAWKEIQESVRGGQLRDDDKFKGKDELQKIVDESSKKIEGMMKKKEQEILS